MTSGDLGALIPLILIAAVFWLLILRPARKRQRDATALQRGLGVGDRVMLTSGLFGTVTALGDDSFELEVATGVVLTVHRQAVAKVVTRVDEPVDGPVEGTQPTDDGGDVRR